MKNAIFVAPYFLDATERFIEAATQVPDARVGLVSCDPIEKISPEIRQRLHAHFAVKGIHTDQMLQGVEAIGRQFGSIDCLMGMLEQIQVPLGEIRDRLGIDGMSAATAANFRDKSRMKNVLRHANIPCARHQLISDIDEASGFAAEIGFPLIVKPPDGAGAKGTYRCENHEQFIDCCQVLDPSSNNPVLIEEFIQGREHSFDSVCVNGKLAWSSISHYFPSPLEVVQEPWIQWCVIIPRESDFPQYDQIRQHAGPALKALGMETGVSHMEWFLRKDGSIAVSEVGARPPGAQFTSLISYAHDFDLYKAWAELLIHKRFNIPEREYSAGAAYLRGMGQGKVSHIEGLQEIATELGDIVVDAKIPKLGQPASGSYEGEGFIIVRHPETSVVENALDQIINRVKVNLHV